MDKCAKCGHSEKAYNYREDEDEDEMEVVEVDHGMEMLAKDDILAELMESLSENLAKKLKKA